MEVFDYSTTKREYLLAVVYRLEMAVALANWQNAETAEEKALHAQKLKAWGKKHDEQVRKNEESY